MLSKNGACKYLPFINITNKGELFFNKTRIIFFIIIINENIQISLYIF